MKNYVSCLSFLFVFMQIGLSQKYVVDGDLVSTSDTTYYNFRSVNFIGGELKSINSSLDQVVKDIKSIKNKGDNGEYKVNDEIKNELNGITQKLATLENSMNTNQAIKVSNSSEGLTLSSWFPWIGILGLGGLMFVMFGRVKRSISNEDNDYSTKIEQLQSDIQTNAVETQTSLLNYVNDMFDVKSSVEKLAEESKKVINKEPMNDHSLALKLADEINKMESNLSLMDNKVKGHRQLSRGVIRLKDNLMANGYEITKLLGTKYNEGMKNTATFIINEELGKGTNIISNILKPEVLFNGKMIQAAHIEVSQN